jgi:hypothetical protein
VPNGHAAQRQPGGERDVLKKILTWGIAIFIVFYLVTQPVGAADVLHSAFNGLKTIGNSLATFVNSL